MGLYGSDVAGSNSGGGNNSGGGTRTDAPAAGVTDDDIACGDDAPVGRRQKHLSDDGIAFTAVIKVEADDLPVICVIPLQGADAINYQS